jgi:AmiR/NasT family two-component response regulator
LVVRFRTARLGQRRLENTPSSVSRPIIISRVTNELATARSDFETKLALSSQADDEAAQLNERA